MIRRRAEFDDDNPERWLVSYADFITLLFAFFVVMYSVSTFKKVQHDELTQAINKAFTHQDASASQPQPAATENTSQVASPPLPKSNQEKVTATERDTMTALGQALAQILAPMIEAQQAKVMQNSSGLHIIILDDALFANGSADLTEAGIATVNAITTPLLNSQHAILVEGHTDNTPIHIKNAAFFSNWELAAVRASSIIGAFNDHGLQKSRLSALGYGPSQPITSNDTLEGKAVNRHMSILVLYDSISVKNQDSVVITPEPISPVGPEPSKNE